MNFENRILQNYSKFRVVTDIISKILFNKVNMFYKMFFLQNKIQKKIFLLPKKLQYKLPIKL